MRSGWCSRGAAIRSDKFGANREAVRMELGAAVCREKKTASLGAHDAAYYCMSHYKLRTSSTSECGGSAIGDEQKGG